mmetsp:Transcript_30371/g.98090  ORF Transcript_30371/g.98090 Transcript_30371/m.98090 type:complete len:205 (-) Transcript_30371:306-920(-)|eukprot:scaffold158_cov126-Isochrysis_galbana.AAC.3
MRAARKNAASCAFFLFLLKASMAPRNLGETKALASSADSSALTRLSRASSALPNRRPPPAAMRCSTNEEAVANSSSGPSWTTPSMSLACSASAAVGVQFSSPSIRCALAAPMRSAKVTLEPPSGGTPNLANGSEKVALGEAKQPSIRRVDVTAAPIAGPLTAAAIGFGNSRMLAKSRWFWSRICRMSFVGAIGLMIADKSTPAL